MPLGCPLGCPREAPVLVWCLFPLGFYNIAQADCFFKRQEEEPILFGSSTGYSAFAYMLLNALFTMVDSASGLLYAGQFNIGSKQINAFIVGDNRVAGRLFIFYNRLHKRR